MESHTIIFLVYPGFELLDLSGPVSAFSNANDLCETQPYKVKVVSINGGVIESDSGVAVSTLAVKNISMGDTDTVLVVGGNYSSISTASINKDIQDWLKKASGQVLRFGSICSGAFILAAAKLLENRHCTTHWLGAKQLQKMYPEADVQAESLYVIDGKLWTSAGVTTGLDMALEMVRQDLGNTIMTQVAKQLVVYAHRPGNQSQFSNLLKLQSRSDSTYSNLLAWIDNNIDQVINVVDMARYMGMTERTFYRKFTAAFNTTPSKYIEEVKLERAKQLLEKMLSVSQVAEAVGFKSESAFRARFESRFGLTPAMHKRLHSGLKHNNS
jgi:transcriptional regulator GlxA family with amidase domain